MSALIFRYLDDEGYCKKCGTHVENAVKNYAICTCPFCIEAAKEYKVCLTKDER